VCVSCGNNWALFWVLYGCWAGASLSRSNLSFHFQPPRHWIRKDVLRDWTGDRIIHRRSRGSRSGGGTGGGGGGMEFRRRLGGMNLPSRLILLAALASVLWLAFFTQWYPEDQQIGRDGHCPWPVDAMVTVARGDFFEEKLLPVWLQSLRRNAGWKGPIVVGCEVCSGKFIQELTASGDRGVIVMSMANSDIVVLGKGTPVPKLKSLSHHGLGRRRKASKLLLLDHLMTNKTIANFRRMMFLDVDAMASETLSCWLNDSGSLFDRMWGKRQGVAEKDASCVQDMAVPRERFGVEAPINTGVMLVDSQCSQSCLAHAIKAQLASRPMEGQESFELNDQVVLISLMRSGLCRLERLPASIQRFMTADPAVSRRWRFFGPSWRDVSGIQHYTRAMQRMAQCEDGKNTVVSTSLLGMVWRRGIWNLMTNPTKRLSDDICYETYRELAKRIPGGLDTPPNTPGRSLKVEGYHASPALRSTRRMK